MSLEDRKAQVTVPRGGDGCRPPPQGTLWCTGPTSAWVINFSGRVRAPCNGFPGRLLVVGGWAPWLILCCSSQPASGAAGGTLAGAGRSSVEAPGRLPSLGSSPGGWGPEPGALEGAPGASRGSGLGDADSPVPPRVRGRLTPSQRPAPPGLPSVPAAALLCARQALGWEPTPLPPVCWGVLRVTAAIRKLRFPSDSRRRWLKTRATAWSVLVSLPGWE